MHLRIKIKKKENYGISNLTKKIIINKINIILIMIKKDK